MVACVIQKKGLILIVRRPSEGLLGGMWEFPAGVIQPEEEPSDACTRVAARTVHVKITGTRPVATIRHTYTHFRITMEVFLCQWLQGRVKVDGPVEFRWIDPRRISEYPIHRAVLKAWPRIKELLN
jgi:A/G-specific adenine glycosylase